MEERAQRDAHRTDGPPEASSGLTSANDDRTQDSARTVSDSDLAKLPVTLEHVTQAASRIREHIVETPIVHSTELSETTGNEVFLKLENFQVTHSFKARGALNRILTVSARERDKGVIAASSGNHGLGIAYASSLLGVSAIIVVPIGAPDKKLDQIRRFEAEVVRHGDTYDEALIEARRLARETGRTPLPSFDDGMIIAGQGTIGLEILEDLPAVDMVIVPVGGGGLIAGLAVAFCGSGHSASLIGVQAEGAASMHASLDAGERLKLPQIGTIADGIAVQQPGKLTFQIVSSLVSAVVAISDVQIHAAMRTLLWKVGVVAEPAAAAPVAALLARDRFQGRGKTICCVITGGNISDEMLTQLIL